jgi:hypothetical protein
MKIPAAMARIAKTGYRPLIAGIRSNRPQAISQMASKNMPIFLLNLNLLMKVILSLYYLVINELDECSSQLA